MTLPRPKSLHPFFDGSRRSVTKTKTPSNVKEGATSLTGVQELENGDATEANKTAKHNHAVDSIISTDNEKPAKQSSTLKTQLKPDTQDSWAVKDTIDASPELNVINEQQESKVLVQKVPNPLDENIHDSKRRRLSPSNEMGTWLQQLQREAAEATGNKLYAIAPMLSSAVLDRTKPLSTAQEVTVSAEVKTENESQKDDPKSMQLKAPADTMEAASSQPMGDSTEVLRLNGKGGLSFPRLAKQTTRTDQNAAESARAPGRGRRRRKLVIVLRYGMGDCAKRSLLGQKIDQVLSSACRPATNSVTPRQEAPFSVLMPIPPPATKTMLMPAIKSSRPTHPFFLGKVTPRETENSTLGSSAVDSTIELKGKSPKNLRSFTTPGKLRSQALLTHADDGAEPPSHASTWPTREFRLPGTVEPAWPFQGFANTKPFMTDGNVLGIDIIKCISGQSTHPRKQKNKAAYVASNEDVLHALTRYIARTASKKRSSSPVPRVLPRRLVLTGQELQSRLRAKLSRHASGGDEVIPHEPSFSHPASRKLYHSLPSSLSAFDQGQCDSQAWCQKYAPQSSAAVLQPGKEMQVLKAWLESQTIAYVKSKTAEVTQSSQRSSKAQRSDDHEKIRKRRRRQKRSDELDGFIVSSDEEPTDMCTLSDEEHSVLPIGTAPVSLIREVDSKNGRKRANAVLLSGPHGCGKTAAAYAVAKELGFEVFEIGPGGRRSGKDILDKVGDMTLNHQVRRAEQKGDNLEIVDDTPSAEADEQQSTLKSFFTTAQHLKRSPENPKSKLARRTEKRQKQVSRQKQALILLEEVDVLFEEDKQFWETVLDLAVHSKRPIILTCSDENVVPLNALSLHAILRFNLPPASIAVDYLLLLAAAEGHLLRHEDVTALYQSRKMDLRGSIMDLDFWCQMALGDKKGGMEWFLKRWPPGVDLDEKGRKLRVVSDKTYRTHLNLFGEEPTVEAPIKEASTYATEEDLLNQAWAEWCINPVSISEYVLDNPTSWHPEVEQHMTPRDRLAILSDYASYLDSLSATDIFSTVGLPLTQHPREVLDSTQPQMTAKTVSDSTQGYPLLQADAKQDFGQLDTKIAITVHLSIKYLFESQFAFFPHPSQPTTRALLHNQITTPNAPYPPHLTRADLSSAFDPISEPTSSTTTSAPTTTVLSHPGLHASSFDRPLALITEDLAPYVRSIAAHDLALQRLLLSAHPGKRLRTTRAARSAAEGGRRATTRRVRWFEAKTLNLERVLRTGGERWPKWIGRDGAGGGDGDGDGTSRASSVDPVVE